MKSEEMKELESYTGTNLERQKYHMAAVKAWETMRRQKIERIKAEYESVDDYLFDKDMRKVALGSFKINPPLIKPSKLTNK